MTSLRTSLVCLAIVFLVSGCGLKGDLYLPQTTNANQPAPGSVEATNEDEDDPDADKKPTVTEDEQFDTVDPELP